MRAIFKNKENERAITRKGYAVIRNLVQENVCDELKLFFEQSGMVDQRPFSISNWNNDETYRAAIYNKVASSVLPFVAPLLNNFKPVLAVYTAKRPGEKSDMLIHQDWSLVDEIKFRSVSVWVALCDMHPNNGNLQVAEYSHIYCGFPRGMNVPVPFENIRSKMHESFLTDLPLKKGDAVVFEHRLIHASPPNNSAEIRLAAVLALIPAEAELIHYYKHLDNNTQLELLVQNDDDLKQVNYFDAPNKPKHRRSLGMVPAEFRQLTLEDLETVISEQKNELV